MTSVARVRQEGAEVLLVIDGHGSVLPWDAAIELGRALMEQGHRAEEIAKATQVIEDQALLTRIGAPFGVAVHPDIVNEAAKEAVNSTKLRRYLPGGVKSTSMVHAPGVELLRRQNGTR
jgi:hypothetical protein